jgi:2-polyprenyl-6-methoxyphenol hydroxylase-like FAD-dependent oxidoreductase
VTAGAAPLVIVGGGPAGMMAGLLFARAGVPTLVLEKHRDFLRDFRGDTVHPSTLELFAELGALDRLLARPHNRVAELSARIAGRSYRIADFGRLPVAARFIAMMPQWEFLDFLRDEAERHPAFALRLEAEAVDLGFDARGRVDAVRLAGGERLPARLVIAADGRRSVLRGATALPLTDLGAPIDVFWFRLPRRPQPGNDTMGIVDSGRMLVLIDRGDYWQAAYVIPKGGATAVQARGLPALRAEVARLAPEVAGAVEVLVDWDQLKLLSVSLDRLDRWHRPGLLAIGDAAHAMSPVGGVGINLAIQDAVAAANILAAPLARGDDVDALLPRVQARRLLPVRLVQAAQRAVHDNVLSAVLDSATPFARAPLPIRLLDRSPRLRGLPARLVGLGLRREHIRSPRA